MPLPVRRAAAILAGATLALVPAATAIRAADAATPAPPTFHRINIDTGVTGAAFTVVGEVFAGEQNIVTTGFGTLGMMGLPTGGGSLQVYRPLTNLADWRKVTVFDSTANVVFPNQPTLADVDGDGDQDVIVPGGNFFDSVAGNSRGSITWWENKGVDGAGAALAFERHDVITGQAWAYHGIQFTDLDGDGVKDILSVGEQGKNPSNGGDDLVETQFFKGNPDHETFAAPVALSEFGGSLPVVADVDKDGDSDIVTAQYFDVGTGPADAGNATFLWLERTSNDATLSADDYTKHTIATLAPTAAGRGVGMGFQIRPVPGFRGPGTVSWIGTNHMNRCTQPFLPAEQVLEFTPPADPKQPWALKTLSTPAAAATPCPANYSTGAYPIFPGDEITSRAGNGQGAPGVFGYGDIDGDGDVDLLVSGDGDRRLFWIEQLADGGTVLHRLTGPAEQFGQAAGAVVVDLDKDGKQELVFSSFDRNTVAVWQRDAVAPAPTPATLKVPSSLRVGPAATTVKAGKKATWSIRLTGAPGGDRRTVTVSFDPKKKGKTVKLATIKLTKTSTDGAQKGKFGWRPKKAGRLVVTYQGTSVSEWVRDTRASDAVRIRIR
jgi:hypothetical protein